MSIIVLNTKVLIQVSIFTSADPPTTHPPFTWSFEPREGLADFRVKAIPSSISYFKTLKKGPVRGIQPTSSRFEDKRYTVKFWK